MLEINQTELRPATIYGMVTPDEARVLADVHTVADDGSLGEKKRKFWANLESRMCLIPKGSHW